MAERLTKLTPYRLDYVCDSCGHVLESTGERTLQSFLGGAQEGTLQYQHKCGGCGRLGWLAKEYPSITYGPSEATS